MVRICLNMLVVMMLVGEVGEVDNCVFAFCLFVCVCLIGSDEGNCEINHRI